MVRRESELSAKDQMALTSAKASAAEDPGEGEEEEVPEVDPHVAVPGGGKRRRKKVPCLDTALEEVSVIGFKLKSSKRIFLVEVCQADRPRAVVISNNVSWFTTLVLEAPRHTIAVPAWPCVSF